MYTRYQPNPRNNHYFEMEFEANLIILMLVALATSDEVTGKNTIEPKISDNTTCEVNACYADKLKQMEKKFENLKMQVRAMQIPPQTPNESCPQTHFIFPRDNQQEDYIRYKRYFPTLKAATMCAFVYFENLVYAAAVANYKTSTDGNAILIQIIPGEFVDFWISSNNHFYYDFSSDEQYHICAWFDSKSKIMGVYVNGEDIGTQGYDGSIVEGGGSLMIGQDEQSDSSFYPNRSFRGTHKNFIIYPRVLTQVEIIRMAFQCQCPVDHVISMTLDKVEFSGETTYSVSNECPISLQ